MAQMLELYEPQVHDLDIVILIFNVLLLDRDIARIHHLLRSLLTLIAVEVNLCGFQMWIDKELEFLESGDAEFFTVSRLKLDYNLNWIKRILLTLPTGGGISRLRKINGLEARLC